MSTIKSSAENLTLNADGANNDIKFQSNGSEVASIDQAGLVTGSKLNLTQSAGTVGTVTIGGTTNAYSAPVLLTVSDLGLDITDGTKHLASWASHGGSSHAGSAIGTRSNHDLALITNDTKRMVINTAGVVSVPVGIELGSGIDGTAANTLEDYEEGSWTPAYAPHGGSFSSIGYVGATPGRYVKIGKQVTCFFYIGTDGVNTSGASGTNVYLTGLPFAAENIGAGVWGTAVYSEKWGGDTPTHVSISSTENKLRLWYRTSANGSSNNALGYSDMGTGSDSNYIRGFITYTT